MNRLSACIRLLRPVQWVKNVFVLAPIVFGGALFDGHVWLQGLVAFFAFSFVASSVYCFNDIHDVADDRRHPVKCHRPIASGAVSVRQAYALMVLMLLLATGACVLLGCLATPDTVGNDPLSAGSGTTTRRPLAAVGSVAAVLLFYWLLNLAYCVWLKHYAIIDVCVVAFGFVLRLLVGGLATGIVLSKWIVLMTFLLTLFMSFAKRRDDVLRMERTGEAPRKNTSRYNETFINQALTITASVTLVCYIMYTVSPEVMARHESDYLYLTSIFVLVGLLRYMQIAVVDKRSGDPTYAMLHDRIIQLVILAWGLSFLLIIYVL